MIGSLKINKVVSSGTIKLIVMSGSAMKSIPIGCRRAFEELSLRGLDLRQCFVLHKSDDVHVTSLLINCLLMVTTTIQYAQTKKPL